VRQLLLVSAVILVTAACSGGPSTATRTSPSSEAATSPLPAATIVSGGCGATPVLRGGVPAWLDEAGAHNNPDGLPYIVATASLAAGFIFGYPLRAGHPPGPANKILWVVGMPRDGSALEIEGHPLKAPTPSIHVTQQADSGPGEIYPSIVDVPRSGCWHFDLSWAGHHAVVDLMYQ
jgi:hypothetical protein